jgi:transcriptional regulator with XRE-family HTH domain
MDVRQRLAINLRRLRQAKGLSQEKFALEHHIDRTYVSGIERGRRNPTITIVAKLATALGVDVSELLAPAQDERPGTSARHC